jgi:hypothetical protein
MILTDAPVNELVTQTVTAQTFCKPQFSKDFSMIQKPQSLSSSITITNPDLPPGETTISPDGTVKVTGIATGTPLQVQARIYRSGETIPNDPPADAIPGGFNGNDFTVDKVPGAYANIGTANTDNQIAVWVRYGANWDVAFASFHAKATTTFDVKVTAKQAIWFAWAPDGYEGPQGESGSAYRPVSLLVPADAASVGIEANDDMWRHDPNNSASSNANGLSKQRPLERDGYRTAAFNNLAIRTTTDSPRGGIKANLNLLVCCWQMGTGIPPADSTDEIGVGKGPTSLDVPSPLSSGEFAYRLMLAFHDGYQWTNNSGDITATVTWSADDLTDALVKKT